MEVMSIVDGYVISDNGELKEGRYESEHLATVASQNLTDIDLSQIYIATLSYGRSVITKSDYDSYVLKYK